LIFICSKTGKNCIDNISRDSAMKKIKFVYVTDNTLDYERHYFGIKVEDKIYTNRQGHGWVMGKRANKPLFLEGNNDVSFKLLPMKYMTKYWARLYNFWAEQLGEPLTNVRRYKNSREEVPVPDCPVYRGR
jgi:hypothetical protein